MSAEKWSRRLGRVLALCLVLTLLPGVNAAAAEIEALDISFQREDHSVVNENGEIELYYDLAQIPQSYPHRMRMNTVLASEYLDYVNSIQGLEEYLAMPDAHLYYTMSGEVNYDRAGVLSLLYTMDWFMGGVSNWGWHGLTFDLDTGEKISLDELLDRDGEEIMAELRPVIMAYAQLNGGWEWSELENIVGGYTAEALDYYVAESGELVLCIPQYELGPGASGPMLIPTGLYHGEVMGAPEEESLLDILLSPSGGAAQGLEPVFRELSASEQYEINVFLSNFAEQYGFTEYPGTSGLRVAREADFAHVYCKVNRRDAIEYRDYNGGSYETLTLAEVNSLADRFFGREITDDMARTGYPRSEYSFYEDGRFWYMAADGEAYDTFVVADWMGTVFDDVCFVSFTVYELDLDIYFDEGITRGYYEMTPAAASEAPELTVVGYGVAVVEPYDLNGRSTYRLLEYRSW